MSEPGEALSDRELEVLRLLPSGASNKSIAEELSISPYTVKTHLRNIFAKLDVSTRTEAITVAMQQGVLAVPGETAEDGNGQALTPLATDPAPLAPVVEATAEPVPVATPAPRRRSPWLYLGPALLLLLGVLGAVYWFTQQPLGQAATPAPLFAEEPIGDSRWLTSRPLPEPRVSQAIASVGLDIYHIGGETAAGVTSDVWAYDTGARLWTEAAAKPAAVADTTAAELFGEIYVPGGRQPDGQPTNLVEAYSPTQDAWRRVAPLPQPLSGALTLADGGFLYVIGGQGADGGALDTVYVYDPGADTWRPVAPLPAPRALAAGAALTGQLVVVGGTDGAAAQATCFTYSPAADAWQTCPDMLAARAGAGATVVLNKLYVVGGTSGQDTTGANGEIYDPNSQIWQVLTVPPELAAWQQPGVVHVENRLFAQGGRRGEALSDANLIYSPFVFQSFIPAASSGSGE